MNGCPTSPAYRRSNRPTGSALETLADCSADILARPRHVHARRSLGAAYLRLRFYLSLRLVELRQTTWLLELALSAPNSGCCFAFDGGFDLDDPGAWSIAVPNL